MPRNFSLQSKLMTLIVGICVAALTLFGYEAYQGLKNLEDSKKSALETAASSVLDKIDRNLFERYGDVQAFALSEPAQSLVPARITKFMNDMMGAYAPIYDLMIVVNARGEVLAANTANKAGGTLEVKDLIGKNMAETNWFKHASSGEIKPGTSYVEDLQIDADVAAITKTSGRSMNFSAPILDSAGKVIGVWTNRMSWSDVVEAIVKEETAKLVGAHLPLIWPYLVDNSGRYLLHPRGAEFELVKSWDGPNSLAKATIEAAQVEFKEFTGDVFQATAPSKGYSSYPSKGWKMLLQTPTSDAQTHMAKIIMVIAGMILFAGASVAFVVVRRVSTDLKQLNAALSNEAEGVRGNAAEVATAAQSLAQASTEQAASLQETAAAVEELTAGIKKNAENALRSQKVSVQSQDVAAKGRDIVGALVQAMEGIQQNTQDVFAQVETNNVKVGEIVTVISEIGTKTRVINEIVFQTKLLSFNASVEAARAGVHGKGFAVVAEEVGKLAQLSGNAAKEISDLLTSSIARVEKVVEESRREITKLIATSQEKIESGHKLAVQCGDDLNQIVFNATEVNQRVSEIATAVNEQATGIAEISNAMTQLEQVTQKNAANSEQTATSSKESMRQSAALFNVVGNISSLISGMRAGYAADLGGHVEVDDNQMTKAA